MTKLPSTSIRDMLIDSIKDFPREVVEKVIKFQGEDFYRATKEANQIEISGFGVLFVSKGVLERRIKSWEDTLIDDGSPKAIYLKEAIELAKIKRCQLLKNI